MARLGVPLADAGRTYLQRPVAKPSSDNLAVGDQPPINTCELLGHLRAFRLVPTRSSHFCSDRGDSFVSSRCATGGRVLRRRIRDMGSRDIDATSSPFIREKISSWALSLAGSASRWTTRSDEDGFRVVYDI